MRKKLFLSGLIFSLFQLIFAQQLPSELPNIIFYLADDQDIFDYGVYGNTKVNTSAVDKLASEGMIFTNAYTAQAICAPSRSQLYTGNYPLKNGCYINHIAVQPTTKDVNDYLQSVGYEVILAGKSHVKPNKVFNWNFYFPNQNKVLPFDQIETYLSHAKKPFCIFVTSDLPHGPYPKESIYNRSDIQPTPYSDRIKMGNTMGYYQNIENDNAQLERILEMVDRHGLKDSTLFMYASDHGIRGKYTVTESGLRVPLIVRWPGVVSKGSISNTMVGFIDVLPTIMDIAGADISNEIDGKSFKKVLVGDASPIHEYLFGVATRQNVQHCYVFPSRSIRGKRFKLIRNFNALEIHSQNLGSNPVANEFIRRGANRFSNLPYEELYDLEIDPHEQNNLASRSEFSEIKRGLASALQNWMIEQNDILMQQKMPLLKPTLHPLDRNSKWNKIPENLLGMLEESDYIPTHY